MHINLESDYALRLVRLLAGENRRLDAGTISERAHVSLRFTLKIMHKLVAAGIVRSFKGPHGGYTLAKAPRYITMRQVIEAVEGPYRFSRCLDEEYDCTCGGGPGRCPFHAVFDDITRMVTEKLESTTFDTLL